MKKYIYWSTLLLAVAAFAVGCGSPRYAQNNENYGRNSKWVLLGQTGSDSRSRGNVIYPRTRNNNFSQLRLTTSGGQVLMEGITVTYDNGRRESYRLNTNNRNGSSRVINLKNRYGAIRQINVDYDGNRYNRNRRSTGGSVYVYGR